MNVAALVEARRSFHTALFGGALCFKAPGLLSNADADSKPSVAIALAVAERMFGDATLRERLPGQSSGKKFEEACSDFVATAFPLFTHLRPGTWEIGRWIARGKAGKRRVNIALYEQYSHLVALYRAAEKDPELAAALQSDYIITPDVVIARQPEPDEVINARAYVVDDDVARLASLRRRNNELPILHASISCKWTLRSDRAQNARTEGLNLIRNRKGKLPHVVVVTGEPLPSRLASLAYGTGDIDCVYHIALPELLSAVKHLESGEQGSLRTMVAGKRLRDIADLPLDLAV